MRRFVQAVIYLQMVFVGLAAVVGFLAHRIPIADQEQPLGRQVGFLLLAGVVTLWIVSRLWPEEPRLLLIPIVFTAVGVANHGFDAIVLNAKLGLAAPSGGDIYPPLAADLVFLALYVVGYLSVRGSTQHPPVSVTRSSVASAAGTSR